MVKSVKENKRGYNQLVLRWIAMLCTVLAIASHSVLPTLRILGHLEWIAFPIYAYLLCEGVEHSMGKSLYAFRLFLFAFISEFPYDLLLGGMPIDPRRQNVLFTLLIAYILLLAVDFVRTRGKNIILTLLAEVGAFFLGSYMLSELRCAYSEFAMAFVLLFYIARRVRYEKIMEFAVTVYIAVYISTQTFVTPKIGGLQYDLSVQIFAIAALLLIWMYNGKRGPNTVAVRYITYAYFPASLFIFWFMAKYAVFV